MMKKFLGTFLSKFKRIKLTEFVSEDWFLKVLSLVLAVVLWHFVGGEDRVDKNVMIPIEIINLPRDLIISNQFKKEIEVTVSGPRSLILEMTSRAITRQVDLSSASPGTMVIENDNDHIPVPRGITVQRVQPSSIILSLDKLIQKQYPISARTVGEVAPGYLLQSLKMDPDVITITGPFTILSQFDEIFTKSINLEGMKKSAQLQVPLELDPAIVELIGETSVTADVRVVLDTVTKTMEETLTEAVVDGAERNVQPIKVKVTANIPKLLLRDKADPKSLLTVTAMKQEGDEELVLQANPQVGVELPIEILSIIPATVSLKDSKIKSGAKVAPVVTQPEEKVVEDTKEEKVQEPIPAVSDIEAPESDKNVEPPLKVLKNQKNKRKMIE